MIIKLAKTKHLKFRYVVFGDDPSWSWVHQNGISAIANMAGEPLDSPAGIVSLGGPGKQIDGSCLGVTFHDILVEFLVQEP